MSTVEKVILANVSSMIIHLLSSLFHFFFHLALVGFHWIIGLSAIYALTLIVKEPKSGLVIPFHF